MDSPIDRQSSVHGPSSAPAACERRIILLGSTGSIGTQTLDVISHLNQLHARGEFPVRYRVVGLATGKQAELLSRQARQFDVPHLALADESAWTESIRGVDPTRKVRVGTLAAEQLVREVECDMVLAAMVGAAGLPATLAALELGRDVALANKETLVAAGELVVPAARRSQAKLLPVDSEHAGVWQALQGCHPATDGSLSPLCPPMRCNPCVSRIVLTASGGPFRLMSREQVYHATPAQALDHPTWKMGPKVTIDSASLTNKALEIIEAHWLFGVPGDKIEAIVHPQSIIHALVEFADGSVVAQLASPDMRLPIQAALAFPHHAPGVSRKLDIMALSKLEFSPPDFERFPALGLAYEVIRRGGTSGAVFNAANEAAVELFLAGAIPFGQIPELTARAMNEVGSSPLRSLNDVQEADAEARRAVKACVGAMVR
ncbi:MAG: 1-deoxy-D-xylulose-5-phosphate reductoisomerase [Pyrinomonadaceae bacterium]|nr:1-deoxy-D-xylulose-5-phosphate reductoisomerase [Phycisphaerales bacterium]